MPYLDLYKPTGSKVAGYLVTDAYAYKERLKQLGAKWMPELKAWKVPPTVDPTQLDIPIIMSQRAERWLNSEAAKIQHLANLHFAKDAVVKYPQGLLPYQRVGVRFLADATSCILADDVGLGKTAEAIRAAMEVRARRVLVVTKKTLLYNWIHEIKRWAGIDAFVLTTQNRLPMPTPLAIWIVTNYETVVKRLDELLETYFNVLIVDEASAIKNRKAQRSKAVHKLAKKIQYVWLLTATPAPNHPTEMWSLLHCIRPDVYTSYWKWVDSHCEWDYSYWGGREIGGVKDPKKLAKELAPLMLRRDKSLLDLPPVTWENVWLDTEGEQRRIYRELRTRFLAVLDEERIITAPSVLAQLTRLRQVVCSPALVGGPDESVKTNALLDLLEELTPNHKVLIFTTFAEYVKLLLPKLKEFGTVHITGDMSTKARAEAVERFNKNEDCRVLIGTIQAAGEGLNLQAADVVVFLNKSWVPAENEIQAVGRAHRQGQTKPVHVMNLLMKSTVDEYVEEVLTMKKEMVGAVEHIAERLRRE